MRSCKLLAFGLALVLASSVTAETNQNSKKQNPRPYARVTSIRPVVRDGWYNAWTDLIWWKDYFWLAHFRGMSHGISRNTTGRIAGNSFSVILRSGDLRRWHEAQVFEPPGGIVDGSGADNAHFCATEDRLYAFFRVVAPEHQRQVWVSWTENGVRWSEPQVTTVGDDFPYIWRARRHNGKFYSATGEIVPGDESFQLIVSDDGIRWSRHAQISPSNARGFSAESELHWRPDGEMWCVIRTGGPAVLYCAKPPYVNWEETLVIHAGCDAPSICESGGEVYLAGRAAASSMGLPNPDGTKPFELQNTFSHPNHPNGPRVRWGTTGLYRLRRDRADLLVTMPPGADAAYPGLVSLEPGKLIMSYYSDVAYISGQVRLRHFPEYRYKESECDIYIAEIEVGEVFE